MSKIREIRRGGYRVTPVQVTLADDPAPWLVEQACTNGLTTLLAHADDAVIWGRVIGQELHTSHDAFDGISAPLRTLTLQQARLFGPQAELLLWREETGWLARLVKDVPDANAEYYDESQILWGDQRQAEHDGFTLVYEGQQGLRHAPPLVVPEEAFAPDHHPLRLRVRHYLATDAETGLLRAALCRLVALDTVFRDRKEAAQ